MIINRQVLYKKVGIYFFKTIFLINYFIQEFLRWLLVFRPIEQNL
jgi:hypothetical protein